MSRRAQVKKRIIPPDSVYSDVLVAKLINKITHKGKKSVAETIVYGVFDSLKKKTKEDPVKIFYKALDNVKPLLEVKSRRIGGATYQVPVEVRFDRKISLALRWLVTIARKRSGKSMEEKLTAEILEASQNKGMTVKKREEVHKMAEANKAFAHYRW